KEPATAPHSDDADLKKAVDRLIINHFAPAGVVVNDNLDVLQFRGDCRLFLAPTTGRASLNLVKIVHQDLIYELKIAMTEILRTGVQVCRSKSPIQNVGGLTHVDFKIIELQANLPRNRHFFIV